MTAVMEGACLPSCAGERGRAVREGADGIAAAPGYGSGAVVRMGQPLYNCDVGMWRSLVAHLTGGQGVAGSNPVIPTTFNRSILGT